MPRLRWLVYDALPQKPVFSPRPVHVGHEEDHKVAQGQVFLSTRQFFPVGIIPPMPRAHI
jgi:hypothetical protein